MAREKVVVVGLGYVGIPLSALLADRGFDVVGVDIDDVRVRAINKGLLPLKGDEPGLQALVSRWAKSGRLSASRSYEACRGAHAVFVCVDTPLDAEKRPDNSRLREALRRVGENLTRGTLIVIESTLAPGTMNGLVVETLERESGLKAGKGFMLAHCPERVMPGRLLYNITHYERVIGGIDRKSLDMAVKIYSKLTKGKLHTTDLTTAEVVKTAENAYRDVQIAFANEVALISEKLGADAFEVRRLVNTCPFRDMHVPGAGVGGHCIPKDPLLLVASGRAANPKLIPTARSVNDSMPFHMLDLVSEALASAGSTVEGSVIAVMGASFLQDSGDARNSPSLPVVESLRAAKELRVHDPYLTRIGQVAVEPDLKKALKGADAAVFMVAHKEYKVLTPSTLKKLMRTAVVVDGRNIFDARSMKKAGVRYRGLGKGVI